MTVAPLLAASADLFVNMLLFVICAATTQSVKNELKDSDSMMILTVFGVCRGICLLGAVTILRVSRTSILPSVVFAVLLLVGSTVFFIYKVAVAQFSATDLPNGLPVAIAVFSTILIASNALAWLSLFLRGRSNRKLKEEQVPLLSDRRERKNYTHEGPTNIFTGLLADGADKSLRGPVTVTVPKLTDVTPRTTRGRSVGISRSKTRLNSEILDDLAEMASPMDASQASPEADRGQQAAASEDPAVASKLDKMTARRKNVLNELIQTEKTYNRQLDMILTVFYRPLCQAAIGQPTGYSYSIPIQESQVRIIFGELEAMLLLSKELLAKLEKRVESLPENTPIADIFSKITPFFRLYKVFALNFEQGLQTISVCRANAGFRRFLKECQKKPECGKMWLEDHLIVPIQRIPRYILLLKELRRFTPELHADFGPLAETLEQIEAVAQEMNNVKKEVEKRLLAIQVQRVIKRCPKNLSPAILFVNDFPCCEIAYEAANWREAALGTSSRTGASYPVRDVVIFLFNELVIDATHDVLRGTISRSYEAAKSLTRPDVLRPVMLDAQGKEALHKFKHIHSAHPQDIVIRDLGKLEFSFNYGTFEVFYQSPSQREKTLLLEAVTELQAMWRQDSVRRLSASGRRPSNPLMTHSNSNSAMLSPSFSDSSSSFSAGMSARQSMISSVPQSPLDATQQQQQTGANSNRNSKALASPQPQDESSSEDDDDNDNEAVSTTRMPAPASASAIAEVTPKKTGLVRKPTRRDRSSASSDNGSLSRTPASGGLAESALPAFDRDRDLERGLDVKDGDDGDDDETKGLHSELNDLVAHATQHEQMARGDVGGVDGVLGSRTPPRLDVQPQSGSRRTLLLLSNDIGETTTDGPQRPRTLLLSDNDVGESQADGAPSPSDQNQKARTLTIDRTEAGESES
eukprot:m.208890 g.208890  ORF g.208890 m.208890 type:complete len:920 (+) comp17804_c0_seq1:258-3017(+)